MLGRSSAVAVSMPAIRAGRKIESKDRNMTAILLSQEKELNAIECVRLAVKCARALSGSPCHQIGNPGFPLEGGGMLQISLSGDSVGGEGGPGGGGDEQKLAVR